jgi:hypothetical protein
MRQPILLTFKEFPDVRKSKRRSRPSRLSGKFL